MAGMVDRVHGGSNDTDLPPIATDKVGDDHYQIVKLDIGGDGVSLPVAGILPTKDDYITGEVMDDRVGMNAVMMFTFSAPVQMVLIEAEGPDLICRVDPFGGTPSATRGIVLRDQTPMYLPVTVTMVAVYAPSGTVVHCAGFRR